VSGDLTIVFGRAMDVNGWSFNQTPSAPCPPKDDFFSNKTKTWLAAQNSVTWSLRYQPRSGSLVPNGFAMKQAKRYG